MKLVIDAKGLAEALSIPTRTVQVYASRFPHRLPPRLNYPGRKLLWAVEDVQAWVQQYRATSQPTPQE